MTGANAIKVSLRKGKKKGPRVAEPDEPFPFTPVEPEPLHPNWQEEGSKPTPAGQEARDVHIAEKPDSSKPAAKDGDVEMAGQGGAADAQMQVDPRPALIAADGARSKSKRVEEKAEAAQARRNKIATMFSKRFKGGPDQLTFRDILLRNGDDLSTALVAARDLYRSDPPTDATLGEFHDYVTATLARANTTTPPAVAP